MLEQIARGDILDQEFWNFNHSSTIKTLGIRWNAMSDSLYYIVSPISNSPKCQSLSVIAKLLSTRLARSHHYLGKITYATTLGGKNKLGRACSLTFICEMTSFRHSLHHIQSLKIPRWLDFSSGNKVKIHGFCDASKKTYYWVVYIRTENNGLLFSHLPVGKTRVSPIKRSTIPKLENTKIVEPCCLQIFWV